MNTTSASGHGGASARAQIGVFLFVTFTLSFALEGWMSATESMSLVWLLMWIPGVTGLLCRLYFREGFADISLRITRRGGLVPWALAWFSPILVGLLAYGVAWGTGLAHFEGPGTGSLESLPILARFLAQLGVMLTLGTLLGALFALGEELGWRGYLLTRLVAAGVPHPVWVSGALWALWHVPLILSGEYASSPHPWLSALLFTVDVLAATHVIVYVRLATGSVWSAVLFHAAWNAVIQGVFDYFTNEPGSLWVGESGVLVAAVHVLFAWALWSLRGRQELARLASAG